MASGGEHLRSARERMGLSLDEVASRTRIPQKWLAALESGDTSAFPPGPFLAGYSKQYRTFLGDQLGEPSAPGAGHSVASSVGTSLGAPAVPRDPVPWQPAAARSDEPVLETRCPEPDESTHTLTSPRAREQRLVRMVSIGSLGAVLLVGGFWVANQFGGTTPVELGVAPDQTVLITSASGVGARVRADGRDIHSGPLPAGKQVRFAAHDRLELELDALDGVTLVYNGSTLKPLGLQSRSRRLVFVDDAGG